MHLAHHPGPGRIQAWIHSWQSVPSMAVCGRLQQGPRKHESFAEITCHRRGEPRRLEAGGAAHAVRHSSARLHQTASCRGQGTAEVFPIKAMNKGESRGARGHALRLRALVATQSGGVVGPTLGQERQSGTTRWIWGLARRSHAKLLFGWRQRLLIYWNVPGGEAWCSAPAASPALKHFFTQVASGQESDGGLLHHAPRNYPLPREPAAVHPPFLAGLQTQQVPANPNPPAPAAGSQIILTSSLKSGAKEQSCPWIPPL